MVTILLFILGLLSWFLASSQATQSMSLCGDGARITQFQNLIFDVTIPLQQMISKQPDYFYNNSLESLGLQVCSQSYYKLVLTNDSQVPFNIRKYFQPRTFNGPNNKPHEIGIMQTFRSRDVLTMSEQSNSNSIYYPDAILFNRITVKQTCEDYCFESLYYNPLFPYLPGFKKIKFGMELTERQLDCMLQKCDDMLSGVDVAVVNLNLTPITSMLSYPSFVNRLAKILNEKVALLLGISPLCEFYFRVSMNSDDQLKQLSNADSYRAYFAKFAETWVKKQIDAKTLLDTFPTWAKFKPDFDGRLNYVLPILELGLPRNQLDSEVSCNLQRTMGIAQMAFEEIVLEIFTGSKTSFSGKCSKVGNKQKEISTASLIVVRSVEQAVALLEDVADGSTDIRFNTIYVGEGATTLEETNMARLRNLSNSQNVSISCLCTISHHKFRNGSYGTSGDIFEWCSNWLEQSQLMILDWSANHAVTYHDHLSFVLIKSLELRHNFLRQYPQGKMYVRLTLSDKIATGGSGFRLNLYCQPFLTERREFQQTIITWSNIHKFEVILNPLVARGSEGGWWYNIATDPKLNRTITDFPVLVQRNAPVTTTGNTSFPYTYPCIHWTQHLLTKSAENRIYSGITIDLDFFLSKYEVSTQELQNMLALAFERFTNVELKPSSRQLNTIPNAMESNLVEALLPRGVENGNIRLYIEFQDIKMLELNLEKIISSPFNPFGIHISGWENHTNDTSKRLKVITDKYKYSESTQTPQTMFGITVTDCIREINNGLNQIKLLPYFSNIKYLVCVVTRVWPTNADKTRMQLYLDTHFYIQKYFNATLGANTLFRQRFVSKAPENERTETEDYLKFLNDTNQYAEKYGVTFFMGDAFSEPDAEKWSWWLVSNNKKHQANLNFTELESAYFGRKTQQKYKVLPLRNSKKYIPLIIGLSVFSIMSIAGICGLWIYNRRMRQMFLTKQEVNAFRNGEVVEISEISIGLQYIQVNTTKTLGFNSDLEIKKKYVQLGNVIGRGNFGVVHNGTLRDSVEVAVKVPNPDLSKESFKSMLAEVKILSYIGIHPNVVAFIGAYTKEIERGLIYIITEYCKNGSLEIYLRNRKPKCKVTLPVENDDGYVETASPDHLALAPIVDEAVVDMIDLYKFAYEIASGMEYIACKRVVHSDLSTRNVLLDANMKCKIGDFGLSRKLYESNEYIKRGEEALPWRWMALESLKKMEFTSQSDVWSFGVTPWEIFSLGEIPYPGISWSLEFSEKLEGGLRMGMPRYSSDDIYLKMLACWNVSLDARPSISDMVIYIGDLVS